MEPTPQGALGDKKIIGPLVPPPEDELKVLLELALIGNMSDIAKYANHIAELSEKFVPFADKLRRLVEDFEEKAILRMVEKYLEEDLKK